MIGIIIMIWSNVMSHFSKRLLRYITINIITQHHIKIREQNLLIFIKK